MYTLNSAKLGVCNLTCMDIHSRNGPRSRREYKVMNLILQTLGEMEAIALDDNYCAHHIKIITSTNTIILNIFLILQIYKYPSLAYHPLKTMSTSSPPSLSRFICFPQRPFQLTRRGATRVREHFGFMYFTFFPFLLSLFQVGVSRNEKKM